MKSSEPLEQRVREAPTAAGPGRVHLSLTPGAGSALVLGHGAGGSVEAPDLQIARRIALGAGWSVALVEQPYRVAGRRNAAPAQQLDAAWIEMVADLRRRELAGLELVCGGRSSGARVACRTAGAVGASGVLCLAFPLVTPKGASRQAELDAAGVPALVVQGRADRFGVPRSSRALERTVVRIRGDHGLRSDAGALASAIERWLRGQADER